MVGTPTGRALVGLVAETSTTRFSRELERASSRSSTRAASENGGSGNKNAARSGQSGTPNVIMDLLYGAAYHRLLQGHLTITAEFLASNWSRESCGCGCQSRCRDRRALIVVTSGQSRRCVVDRPLFYPGREMRPRSAQCYVAMDTREGTCVGSIRRSMNFTTPTGNFAQGHRPRASK